MAEAGFSGVPAWLLTAYLVELGGAVGEEGTVRGEGWTATIVRDMRTVSGVTIGTVTIRIQGPRGEETLAALRKKAQRGGG